MAQQATALLSAESNIGGVSLQADHLILYILFIFYNYILIMLTDFTTLMLCDISGMLHSFVSMFDPKYAIECFLNADPMTVYILVFCLMVVESSIIPFPSEVVVPPAAYLACTSHEVNIVLVLLLATLGAIGGALVNYFLSVSVGRTLLYKFANSKVGRACMINEAKVKHAEDYFDRHGSSSTFIGRLIPGVRHFISIPAGLARMNLCKFIIFTGLGAGLWNVILASLGYWLGHMVSRDELYSKVEEYNTYLFYAGISLGVICIGLVAWNMLKPGKKVCTETSN